VEFGLTSTNSQSLIWTFKAISLLK
jgi:hypothetical protein